MNTGEGYTGACTIFKIFLEIAIVFILNSSKCVLEICSFLYVSYTSNKETNKKPRKKI